MPQTLSRVNKQVPANNHSNNNNVTVQAHGPHNGAGKDQGAHNNWAGGNFQSYPNPVLPLLGLGPHVACVPHHTYSMASWISL